MQVFVLTRKAAESALGCSLDRLAKSSLDISASREGTTEPRHPASKEAGAKCDNLLVGETVGTGQFGMVKVAKFKHRANLYALKVAASDF